MPQEAQYDALREAIDAYAAALAQPLRDLRGAVFAAIGMADPTKAEEEPFRYVGQTRTEIDAALETFLIDLFGPRRDGLGFASDDYEDGVIQEQSVESFLVGVERGAALAGAAEALALTRSSPATLAMLGNAFARLSERGTLVLEGIRDEVHGILTSGAAAGLSPLDVGRQLAGLFDDYSRSQFDRLARTEAAFASIEGSREQYRALDVTQVEILVQIDACPICEPYDGQVFALTDTANQPPYHPNCLCDMMPVAEAD